MTAPDKETHDGAPEVNSSVAHRLMIDEIELLGGARSVKFTKPLSLVLGDITTGKTTFVRLLRALIGTVPDILPPEVGRVRALRGTLTLGRNTWRVYRPLVTTRTAPVDVALLRSGTGDTSERAARFPSSGLEGSYSRFLLDELGLPAVSVPEARSDPSSRFTAISMSDWLGYCIITGDDLDSQVFNHRDPFRNQKRRWVFELAYGYYDVELAFLNSQRRGLELRLNALDREGEVLKKFLLDTPFSDLEQITAALEEKNRLRRTIAAQEENLAVEIVEAADVATLRDRALESRHHMDDLIEQETRLQSQIIDLQELSEQLRSQSARLTRAIVADEWLVDFDFVVCPRCGTQVENERATPGHCYLCLQPETSRASRDTLLAEQDRVISQISETLSVIESRQSTVRETQAEKAIKERELRELTAELNHRTSSFISDREATIRTQTETRTRLDADIEKLSEYSTLLERHQDQEQTRADLEQELNDILHAIERRQISHSGADQNLEALEKRTLEYLERLHIPQLGDLLTVRLNRTTFLPEISGRSFDELSSQGLKTLVNVAHALAHHTVAIDRGLPMPGLLVLDGISANAGRDGFDHDRITDMYELLIDVSSDYEGRLQIIAVDNDVPSSIRRRISDNVVLDLSQVDRLIREESQDM